jgi:hypothetical protein
LQKRRVFRLTGECDKALERARRGEVMADMLMARLAKLGTLSADLEKANAAAEESRDALVATQEATIFVF